MLVLGGEKSGERYNIRTTEQKIEEVKICTSGAGAADSAGAGSSAFALGAFVFAGFFSSESAMVKFPNR